MMWVIGIDFGLKHWGLARGIEGIIEPIGHLQVCGGIPNWDEFQKLVTPWNQGHWVMGLPLDRQDQPLAPAYALKRHLPHFQKKMGGIITFVNEDLSTQEANALILRASKKQKKRMNVHEISACLILERYYDAPAHQKTCVYKLNECYNENGSI